MMMFMAAGVMVMVGASNHGNGYEYGNDDSDTGNAIPHLSALTPPSPDPLCTLHLPFIPLTGSQTSDLGPNAWSNSTWFPKSPRAKSTLLSADLGPRTKEQSAPQSELLYPLL